MRFTEFLKTTVLLSAGAATALALVTVLSAATRSQSQITLLSAGWWAIAALIGLALGRGNDASPPIAQLLAGARATTALPEHRPAAILVNRLWPMLVFTVLAGGLSFLAPQVPGIGAGFAIVWALAWRRQHAAVAAIEERDGVRFYVMPTSPVRRIALQRAPGFKAVRPEQAR
ncbi:MAG: hypothetical protein ACRDLF_04050 [Solirubrobacteraceae bacterium]